MHTLNDLRLLAAYLHDDHVGNAHVMTLHRNGTANVMALHRNGTAHVMALHRKSRRLTL
jgi:hypothetical protein